MTDLQKSGYAVVMYYYVDNTDSLVSRLSMLKDVTERKILTKLGEPILSSHDLVDTCTCCKDDGFDVKSIFLLNNSFPIEKRSKTLCFMFNFIKPRNLDLCRVKIIKKIWASFDAIFDSGVYINSRSIRKQPLSIVDKKKLRGIRNLNW